MNNSELGAFACASNGIYRPGLTKREYFAALAMQALISNSSIVKKIDTNNGEDLPLLSITSIAIADELLKQLEL